MNLETENGADARLAFEPLVSPLPLGRVVLGDNCEVMRQWPSQSVDLVVTSPPYDDLRTYGGHSWDFFGVAWNLKRLLKPGGVLVWVVADATKDGSETGTSMEQALHFKRIGLNLHDTMVYQVAGTGAKGSNLAYWQEWEYCFVMSVGRPAKVNRLADSKNVRAGAVCTKGRLAADGSDKDTKVRVVQENGIRGNVWRYQAGNNGDDNAGHPAVFPSALARDHIATWSNPGDIILDCFAGSGTTLKAAQDLGRLWVGIEINPDYIPICEARTAQASLDLVSA
jgi:site-specific DNA-methyltransferase (adenine-specific)